jgi:hypothetical protein
MLHGFKGKIKMSYLKKSYCFKSTPTESSMRVYAGHIKKETAIKNGFTQVNLVIIDTSGKGRGETRIFYAPHFSRMGEENLFLWKVMI